MKRRGPWKIKKSKRVYKNLWIEVKEDKVIRPDGKEGIHALILMKPGISVLPLDKNGYIYLTKEFHYAVGRDSIEVISGGINKREKPLVAAKRELKEETGIIAKKWINLGKVDPFTTVILSPANLYLAKNLIFTKEKKLEGTETISLIKVKLEKAVKMVMGSKITHGPSCVLILKAFKFLSRASRKL